MKNPNDPIWAKDPAVALYRSIMKRYNPARKADRRLQLVRDDRRLDDGRDAPQGREEPHAGRPAEGRAEPRHEREPVPAARDPPADVARRTTGPIEHVYLYRYDNKQWVRASGPSRRAMSARGQLASPGARLGHHAPPPRRNRHDEEPDTYGRGRGRGARRARPRGRRHRRVHVTEALGVVRRGQRRRTSSRPRRSNDDATARAAIVIPTGTTITTTQAPGTKVGTVKAQVSALALGGALLPLDGDIVVAPPGAVTRRIAGAVHAGRHAPVRRCCSCCRRPARRSPCRRTSCRRAARRPPSARHSSCSACRRRTSPSTTGGATFGAKFLSADLTLNGVFGPVAQGAWIGVLDAVERRRRHDQRRGDRRLAGGDRPGRGSRSRAKKVRASARSPAASRRAASAVARRVVTILAGAKRQATRRPPEGERRVHVRRAEVPSKAKRTSSGHGRSSPAGARRPSAAQFGRARRRSRASTRR